MTSHSSQQNDPRQTEKELRALNEKLEQLVAERTADAHRRADQLRDLALSLADAEARERRRLAQRLHDGFQQFLSAARLKAALVRRKVSDENAQAILQVERMLEDAIDESRRIATELSPPVLYDAGLGPAIETIARSFERHQNIEVVVEHDPAAEPNTEQIRVLLFEAIRELLLNVGQHAKAQHVRIHTRLLPRQNVEITIHDDGVGFDPAALERDDQKDKPFGLMEIRERLQYVGGGMLIRSSPGAGTEISISAPARLEHANAKTTAEDQSLLGHSAPPQGKGEPIGKRIENTQPARSNGEAPGDLCRIVVADDHAIFREGLINLLSQEPGLQVVGEAADGNQAVSLVRQLRPDLLIVDVTMPKMSGIDVTSTLSREMPTLKIVGLSMHERQDMAQAMRQAGASAYITKGGSSELLLSVLRAIGAGPRPVSMPA